MPARTVPALSDLLCERCGYTLNGLPETGNCPECGEPIAASAQAKRTLSAFELAPSPATFVRTTLAVLLTPRRFYRTLSVRVQTPLSRRFSWIHRLIVGVLLMAVLFGHLRLTGSLSGIPTGGAVMSAVVSILVGACVAVPLLDRLNALAAWLSHVEATYRGMRLPLPVVRRALDYHAAAYLPVTLVALFIVYGYGVLFWSGRVDAASLSIYLYTLAGYVVVAAAYLFQMFVIAMFSVRWANK